METGLQNKDEFSEKMLENEYKTAYNQFKLFNQLIFFEHLGNRFPK